MNICSFTTTYSRYLGDPMRSFLDGQAEALAAEGNTVHVFTPHDPTVTSAHDQLERGVHVHRVHYWWPHQYQKLCYGSGIPDNFKKHRWIIIQVPTLITGFVRRALSYVRDCDVVHGHWTFGGTAAMITAQLTGKPLVITMYGTEVVSPLLRPINRFLARRANGLISISRFTYEAVQAFEPDAEQAIIPYGINAEKLAGPDFDRAAFRRKHGIAPDEKVVLAVGRLVERKGFHKLVEAADHLDARVIIGGRGPQYDFLQHLAEQVDAAVTLLGFLPDEDLSKWYAAADVFVLPAIIDDMGDTEGLGMVLLEAMANHTPVVASDVGGITDIVQHEETGLLARPGDVDDLAHQINRVLTNAPLRQRLVEQAAQYAEANFSWDAVTAQLCNLYQKVL